MLKNSVKTACLTVILGFFLMSKLFSTEAIGYQLFGNGQEKVLVLHNWFSDCSSYEPMMPYLNTEQFTYVFMDLRGYGRSKHLVGEYSVQEASEDALRLIKALHWEKYHLIGHSMSGMVAQKIAVDDFSHVKSVVAITPVPACGSPKPLELMAFLEDAALSNDDHALECVHLLTSHRYSHFFAKTLVNHWRSCSTPEARIAYLQMFSNTDFSGSVKGLTTPMLVLFGEYDFPGEEALLSQTFLAWYPNAQLRCCESAGHFPIQETPIYLSSMIEKFLIEHTE